MGHHQATFIIGETTALVYNANEKFVDIVNVYTLRPMRQIK
jgi:hypothetical protein